MAGEAYTRRMHPGINLMVAFAVIAYFIGRKRGKPGTYVLLSIPASFSVYFVLMVAIARIAQSNV